MPNVTILAPTKAQATAAVKASKMPELVKASVLDSLGIADGEKPLVVDVRYEPTKTGGFLTHAFVDYAEHVGAPETETGQGSLDI